MNSHAQKSTAPSRQRVCRSTTWARTPILVTHVPSGKPLEGRTLGTGRGGRIRTRDTRIWRPMLYQLSYTPARALSYQERSLRKTSRRVPTAIGGCQGGPRAAAARTAGDPRDARRFGMKLNARAQRSHSIRWNIFPSTNFRFQAGDIGSRRASPVASSPSNDRFGRMKVNARANPALSRDRADSQGPRTVRTAAYTPLHGRSRSPSPLRR